MRALSIRQPWAWAILHAGKDVENRSWQTSYRGLLAVHVGKAVEREAVDYLRAYGHPVPDRLVTGALVGVVRVTGYASVTESWWGVPGQYQWQLTDPRPFAEPIPWRGHLGLFDVPDDVVQAVTA